MSKLELKDLIKRYYTKELEIIQKKLYMTCSSGKS